MNTDNDKTLYITLGDSSDINTYLSVYFLSKYCYNKNYDLMSILSTRQGIIDNSDINMNILGYDAFRNDEGKGYTYDSDEKLEKEIKDKTKKILQQIFNESIKKSNDLKKGGVGYEYEGIFKINKLKEKIFKIQDIDKDISL